MDQPRIGDIIDNRFRLTAALGSGAMGTVYKATQLNLERTVALKFLHLGPSQDGESLARFEREAQALASLSSDYICTAYAYGSWQNTVPFIALEYVQGETLDKILERKGSLPWRICLRIARDLAIALTQAHASGIVHRDLKPSNIFFDADQTGDKPCIKVTDFGLAKLLRPDSPAQDALTSAGTLVGSVLYMSPEQCRGQAADHRADLYALGCVLYHCLFGRPPYEGDTSLAIIFQHAQAPVPLPVRDDAITGLPPALVAALRTLLEKEPEQRPSDAEQTRQTLQSILDKTASLPDKHVQLPDQTLQTNSHLVKQSAVIMSWLLAAGVVLVVGTYYLTPEASLGWLTRHWPGSGTASNTTALLSTADWLAVHGQTRAAIPLYVTCEQVLTQDNQTNISLLKLQARLCQLYLATNDEPRATRLVTAMLNGIETLDKAEWNNTTHQEVCRLLQDLSECAQRCPLTPNRRTIDQFAEVSFLSISVGCTKPAVYFRHALLDHSWRYRGEIPSGHWNTLLSGAQMLMTEDPGCMPTLGPKTKDLLKRFFRQIRTANDLTCTSTLLLLSDAYVAVNELDTAIWLTRSIDQLLKTYDYQMYQAPTAARLYAQLRQSGVPLDPKTVSRTVSDLFKQQRFDGQLSNTLGWIYLLDKLDTLVDPPTRAMIESGLAAKLNKLDGQDLERLRTMISSTYGLNRIISPYGLRQISSVIETIDRQNRADLASSELILLTVISPSLWNPCDLESMRRQAPIIEQLCKIETGPITNQAGFYDLPHLAWQMYTLTGNHSKARQVIEMGMKRALSCAPDSSNLSLLYQDLGRSQLHFGLKEAGRDSLNQSVRHSMNLPLSIFCLTSTVSILAWSGDYQAAGRLIDEGKNKFVGFTTSSRVTSDEQALAANMYACWHDLAGAKRMLALPNIQPPTSSLEPLQLCRCRNINALSLASLNQTDQARKMADEIFSELPVKHWLAWLALADLETVLKNPAKVRTLLQQAKLRAPIGARHFLDRRLYLNSLDWTKTERSPQEQAAIMQVLRQLDMPLHQCAHSSPAAGPAFAVLAGPGEISAIKQFMSAQPLTPTEFHPLLVKLALDGRWPPVSP